MRRVALLGLVLLAGGSVAWVLLGGRPDPSPEVPPTEPLRGPTPARQDGPPEQPAPVELPGPPPVVAEPEDPEWITAPLPLPPGRGPLTGEELVAAVEAAGKVRIRGATPADLEALRRAVFDDVPRDAEHPHAALGGWLKEAGFQMEVAYPTLVVRRLPADDAGGR